MAKNKKKIENKKPEKKKSDKKAQAPKARFVLLNGSPRKKGNTAAAIKAVEDEAKTAGLRLERFDLWKMKVKGCAHCDHCKRQLDKPGCRIKDDLSKVLKALRKADGVLLASPVFCWSVSGCLSSALDRFYCFFKPQSSLLAGRSLAGLFTAGGDADDGADLCVAMCERLGRHAGMDYRGSLVLANCGLPQETAAREDLPGLAKNLVENLVKPPAQ